jgi:S-(hydroxymethyl)glutathione dehydrogenase/alcohol dehydrogenase
MDKMGSGIVVGVMPATMEVSLPVAPLVYEERVLTGSIYGSRRLFAHISMLIDLYKARKLKLDELLTQTLPLLPDQ